MRIVNKSISQDHLWRGRFVIKQLSRTVWAYEDGSGASINYKVGLYDKKTKRYAYGFIEDYNVSMFTTYVVNKAMNKFIVEIIEVWRNEKPTEDTVDYNKINFIEKEYTLINDYSMFR